MTSEQIKAALDRLALESGREKMTTFSVIDAFVGDDAPKASGLCDMLVELLRQADPETHMELPVDAEGEPVHVGDVVQWLDGDTYDVSGVGDGILFYIDCGSAWWTPTSNKTHYRKPTVEDVLREFAKSWIEGNSEEDVFSEYAKRLRKTVKEEQ